MLKKFIYDLKTLFDLIQIAYKKLRTKIKKRKPKE